MSPDESASTDGETTGTERAPDTVGDVVPAEHARDLLPDDVLSTLESTAGQPEASPGVAPQPIIEGLLDFHERSFEAAEEE